MEDNQTDKKHKLLHIIVIALFILALIASIYFYWLWRDCQEESNRRQNEITMLEERLNQAEADSSSPSVEESGPANEAESGLPVVVFSPGGLFTDEEKAEITTKMLNPFRDWYADQGDGIVSIHVQEHFATPDQYTVDAIFDNGVYQGFLYGIVDAPEQEWWHPTCLGECSFTPEFEAAYPEVVSGS